MSPEKSPETLPVMGPLHEQYVQYFSGISNTEAPSEIRAVITALASGSVVPVPREEIEAAIRMLDESDGRVPAEMYRWLSGGEQNG